MPCIGTQLYSMISEENDVNDRRGERDLFRILNMADSTTCYFNNGCTFEVDVEVHNGPWHDFGGKLTLST